MWWWGPHTNRSEPAPRLLQLTGEKGNSMNTRTFALTAGVVYVLVGILGFVPALVTPPPADAPHLTMQHNYGYLLGLFPVNTLHNIVHLAIGLWGLASYGNGSAAKTFAASLAILYALLAIFGLIPGLNTTLGIIPLWGHDVWLHAGTAAVAAYFAWGVSTARRPALT